MPMVLRPQTWQRASTAAVLDKYPIVPYITGLAHQPGMRAYNIRHASMLLFVYAPPSFRLSRFARRSRGRELALMRHFCVVRLPPHEVRHARPQLSISRLEQAKRIPAVLELEQADEQGEEHNEQCEPEVCPDALLARGALRGDQDREDDDGQCEYAVCVSALAGEVSGAHSSCPALSTPRLGSLLTQSANHLRLQSELVRVSARDP